MKYKLIIAFIIAIVIIIGQTYAINNLRKEKNIYKANQETLLSDVEFYKTESGLNAATSQQLRLSYSELEKHYDLVKRTADDLNIKLKRLQSTSTTSTATDVKIITVVKDSIIYRDGRLDSLHTFKWHDPWVDVQGALFADSVDISVHSTDTIVQIVHRVPHQFWFFKWGTKAIKQEVVSSNPHTQITYSEHIQLR